VADTIDGPIHRGRPVGIDDRGRDHTASLHLGEDSADLIDPTPGTVSIVKKHDHSLDARPEPGECEPQAALDVIGEEVGPTATLILEEPVHGNLRRTTGDETH
jgi:hypothetical protein